MKKSRNKRKAGKLPAGLERVNLNAAGIDIGSVSHFVAVPEGRDTETVREFKSFTADLHELANWLEHCGIKTVAMESTGIYWIPLFEILEERGFEVRLVNPRHLKNVPGRKYEKAWNVANNKLSDIIIFIGVLNSCYGFHPCSHDF